MFDKSRNILITGGTFNQKIGADSTGRGFETLHRHIAPGALHNSGDVFDQPRCHHNTRVAILRTILLWVQNPAREFFMMWLHGAAGAGKSAIARSIAEKCDELGLLIASFFFSRTADGRTNTKHFISTIAYQLAQTIPATFLYIERAIERDPSIFDKTLETQIYTLIVHPLQASSSEATLQQEAPKPCLLLVDGLDECDDAKAQIRVLQVLCSLVQQHHLPIAIFVASRPEKHIRSEFDAGELSRLTSRLPLDDSVNSDHDIHIFLSSKLMEIKQRHPFRSQIPPSWPSDAMINTLVQKSSGQFIFPSIVIKFVSSFDHLPHERLEALLGLSHEDSPSPFAELDALYHHIFSTVVDISTVLRILAFKIVEHNNRLTLFQRTDSTGTPDWQPWTIETFLSLKPGSLRYRLASLESIIIKLSDDDLDIQFLHASLQDFLLDRSRSRDFFVSQEAAHADSATCYFRYLQVQGNTCTRGSELLECLSYHIESALPTDKLHSAIFNCDLSPLHFASLGHDRYIWPALACILHVIANSKFSDAHLLSKHLSASIDLYLESRLAVYHTNKSLHSLIVLVAGGAILTGNNAIPESVLWDYICMDPEHNTPQLDKEALYVFDRQDYGVKVIAPKSSIVFDRLYLLRQFLGDPSRSGKYHINASHIATMVFRCIQYISGFQESEPWIHRILIQNIISPLLTRAAPSKSLMSYMNTPKVRALIEPLCNQDVYSGYISQCQYAEHALSSLFRPISIPITSSKFSTSILSFVCPEQLFKYL